MRFRALIATLAVPTLLAAAMPARADAIADFFHGRLIKIIVGASAGGAFEVNARILGRHITRHIPGQPTVVVEAMPGAGGARAMAYLYNAAPQDGTYWGAVLPSSIISPLLRPVKYDSSKFHWLGSLTPMSTVASVWHTAPAKTLAEAKKTPLIMATSSKLSNAYLIPALLNAIHPGYRLREGSISEATGKGRHTTTTAQLLALPGEGFVVDTPGLREFGFWDLERRGLQACFPEIARAARGCSFADCTHTAEAGCAVRLAVEAGTLSARRYASFVKLSEELGAGGASRGIATPARG